ncbi:MAG: hypothetical protein HC817_10890, partial [Saprospiraceae bacterium]|nr:hypothetical protein [Saprospiraceae bacterium]
ANAISINPPDGVAQFYWDFDRINTLFEGVFLDYISLIFNLIDMEDPLPILEKTYDFALKKGFQTPELRGKVILFHTYATKLNSSTVGLVNNSSDTPNRVFNVFQLNNSLKIAAWAAKHLPAFKVLGVQIASDSDQYHDVAHSVARALYIGDAILTQAEKNSESIEHLESISDQIFFEFSCSKNYFMEIAKLRAFKLLWANLLLAYKLTPSVSSISARIFCENTNENTQKLKLRPKL